MTSRMMTRGDGIGEVHHESPACERDPKCHPVVVIDPEDREQVERLLSGYAGWKQRGESPADYPHYVDDMQAALREFANPTPPKPDEPTGLGAVVEAINDNHFVRVGAAGWVHVDDHGGNVYDWNDIAAVRVLSEGVSA